MSRNGPRPAQLIDRIGLVIAAGRSYIPDQGDED